MLIEMEEEPFSGQLRIEGGEFGAVGEEGGAGTDIASGVLVAWQCEGQEEGIVMGDVVEVFDIHLEVTERREIGFDGP